MDRNNLNGQNHYDGWQAFDKMKEVLGDNPEFLLGNVVKYVYRYDKKGTPLEDLEKAKVYLEKKLETVGNMPKVHRMATYFTGSDLLGETLRNGIYSYIQDTVKYPYLAPAVVLNHALDCLDKLIETQINK